jgi:hypothetical protein
VIAHGPDFGDVLLSAAIAAWREDIESEPFPDFSDLLIPTPQQRSRHIPSPECWCEPLAAPGRWQHRGPLPHDFEPGLGDFQPGDRDDIDHAGQPTAIHQ